MLYTYTYTYGSMVWCIWYVHFADFNAKLLLKTFHFALFGVEFKFVSFVIKFPDIKFNLESQFSCTLFFPPSLFKIKQYYFYDMWY